VYSESCEAITLSTGDIDFLKLRTVGDSGALRDKYIEITAHILLGDAGKLSFNFISALDFFILLQILTGQNIYFQFFAGQKLYFRLLQDRLFISGYSNASPSKRCVVISTYLSRKVTRFPHPSYFKEI
jgi:hypothetical protein